MMLNMIILLLFFWYATAALQPTIRCYQCNSADDEQSDCDNTDQLINGGSIAKYLKICKPLTIVGSRRYRKPQKAIGCRKIVQEVQEEISVIRECAYSGDVDVDGKRETGNKAIKRYIYQCRSNTTDGGGGCNAASIDHVFLSSNMIMMLIVMSSCVMILIY